MFKRSLITVRKLSDRFITICKYNNKILTRFNN